MSNEGLAALRRLRDCGVLRVSYDDDAMINLFERGLADTTPVADNEDALDYRLTRAGRVVAEKALRP